MRIQKGLVSRIERFSVHDGPGIRTLVVMKGCPLRCRWCSSPYTQETRQEILYIRSRCMACGHCIDVCPVQAIQNSGEADLMKTDRSLCFACGMCTDTCPAKARERSGYYYSAEELFRTVEKDATFYRRSGGGVTVGGGEPTMQAAFLKDFLSRCRSGSIHTAMETSAFVSWEKLSPLLEHLDVIFVDLKHMDEPTHKQWTGVSNRIILQNIHNISEKLPLILRIPVVPGFNDKSENISASAGFARQLGRYFKRIELLPYHQFGIHKYQELEREYAIDGIAPPSGEQIKSLEQIILSYGIETRIGG